MFSRAAALLLFASALSLASAANVGQATYFTPGEGACGHYNTQADYIVAVSSQFFDTYPGAGANSNTNPVCNKQITVAYQENTVNATVVDACPGCPGEFDLDMSPAVFNQLADLSVGRLSGVSWDFSS